VIAEDDQIELDFRGFSCEIACGPVFRISELVESLLPDSHEQSLMFYRFKGARKTGEGPLHPRPKGWGIRDPPRSQSNSFIVV